MCSVSHTYPHTEAIKHEFRHMYSTNTCDIQQQKRGLGSKWKTGTDKLTLNYNAALFLCNIQLPGTLYMSENDNKVPKMKCRLLSFTLSCVHCCHCLSWSPPTCSEPLCYHTASSELVRVQTIGYITGRTAAVSEEEQRRTLVLASSILYKTTKF